MRDNSNSKFRKIYNQYVGLVYTVVVKILRDNHIAEEVTSDVFVNFFEKYRQYQNENTKAILITIAKNLAINQVKKSTRTKKGKKEFLEKYYSDYSKNSEEAQLKDEKLCTLENLIDNMTERRKSVFKLRYYENHSLKEIAQKMKISVNTVQNHLTKGKTELKAWFRQRQNIEKYTLLLILFFHLIH